MHIKGLIRLRSQLLHSAITVILFLLYSLSTAASSLDITHFDINKANEEVSSSPNNFVTYHGKLYFTAEASLNNKYVKTALWSYDNAANKHQLVKDFTGQYNYLSEFIVFNNLLYFTTSTEDSYYPEGSSSALWFYDSETQKTSLVKTYEDIDISRLTIHNNQLYFTIEGEQDVLENQAHLWRLNDADNSLEQIENLSLYIDNTWNKGKVFTLYNNKAYFLKKGANQAVELWTFESSKNQSSKVIELDNSGFTPYISLIAFNNELYFSITKVNDYYHVLREFGAYNATTSSKRHIADLSASNFVSHNNKLYFGGDDHSTGREPMVYDAITNTVSLLADINPEPVDWEIGNGSSNPAAFTVFNNKLYFWTRLGDYANVNLWQYDFDSKQASKVEGLGPVSTGSNLVIYEDKLYFQASINPDYESDIELYAISANHALPQLVKDINQATKSSLPFSFTEYQGQLYFDADDGLTARELWAYDPTAAAVYLVEDIEKNFHSEYDYPLGSFPQHFTTVNNTLYFWAHTQESDSQLWYFDGTSQEISAVAYGNKTNHCSENTSATIEFKHKLYFATRKGIDDDNSLQALCQYDPQTDTIEQVAEFAVAKYFEGIEEFTVYNDQLYFTAGHLDKGRSIWLYDQENQTTKLIVDTNADNEQSKIENLTVYNNKLYFSTLSLDSEDTSYQILWSYNDATKLTTKITDIPSSASYYTHARLDDFIIHNHKLYFTSTSIIEGKLDQYDDPKAITVLWQYSAENTQITKLTTAQYDNFYSPLIFQDNLVFNSSNGLIFYNENLKNFSSVDKARCDYNRVFAFNSQIFCTANVYHEEKYLGLELIKVTIEGSPALISGQANASIYQDEQYHFSPTTDEFENDLLEFFVENLPSWATFDNESGAINGTPTISDIGLTKDIHISVNDGVFTSYLPDFNIEVIATPIIPTEPTKEVEQQSSSGSISFLLLLICTLLLSYRVTKVQR